MFKLAGSWFYRRCQHTGKNTGIDNSVTFVNEQDWFLKWKYQVKAAVEEVGSVRKGKLCGHW